MQNQAAAIQDARSLQRALPRALRKAPRTGEKPGKIRGKFSLFNFKRQAWKELSFARILRGGRLLDSGRLGRYALIVSLGLAAVWLPAIGYLKLSKPQFTSNFSLILPGAGSASSVNLADIGQASSASNSAYASSTISPTVTYKNLIMSANVIERAAASLKVSVESMPVPTIKLVDETSFIMVQMSGYSGLEARDRAAAIQDAFFSELNKLREDEIKKREGSTFETIRQYEAQVDKVRSEISALQSQTGLNSVDQFNALVSAADGLRAHVAETEANLARARKSGDALAATLNLTPAQAALAMKLHADPQFAALADATAKAQSDFAAAGRQYGANHPKVIEARTRYQGVLSEMMVRASRLTGVPAAKLAGKYDLAPTGQRSSLMSQLISFSTEDQGLSGQLSTEKADLKSRLGKIESLVDVAAKLDKLDHDYKVAEAVFASALARINTSKADIYASYPMVQIIEEPVKPLTPSSPSRKIALGSAAAGTFLLFFALVLGWIRQPLIDKLLKKQEQAA